MEDFLVGGAVTLFVTTAAAVIGARHQARQEHEKWKRERKYEAYMLFFYEVSRVLDWTNDVRHQGSTTTEITKDVVQGVWHMSAGINMHLPKKLEHDFDEVNRFLGKLTTWGNGLLPNPDSHAQLLGEYKPVLDRLQEAMREDLKINP